MHSRLELAESSAKVCKGKVNIWQYSQGATWERLGPGRRYSVLRVLGLIIYKQLEPSDARAGVSHSGPV